MGYIDFQAVVEKADITTQFGRLSFFCGDIRINRLIGELCTALAGIGWR